MVVVAAVSGGAQCVAGTSASQYLCVIPTASSLTSPVRPINTCAPLRGNSLARWRPQPADPPRSFLNVDLLHRHDAVMVHAGRMLLVVMVTPQVHKGESHNMYKHGYTLGCINVSPRPPPRLYFEQQCASHILVLI